MRRGSAVLLTILPLLSPAYGLPTSLGNDAAVVHSNVERAAVPVPAVSLGDSSSTTNADESIPNIASEGASAWLPKLKRQFSGGTASTPSSSSNGAITLDVGAASSQPIGSGNPTLAHIPNIASEGSDHWLLPPKEKREIEEREANAEAEANPAITLDMEYVPPALEDTSDINLGPRPVRRRKLNL